MNKYLIPGLTASTMILAVAFAYSIGTQAQSSNSVMPQYQYQNARAVQEWNVSPMGNNNHFQTSNPQSNHMNPNSTTMHTPLDLTNLDLSGTDVTIDEIENILTILINDEYKNRAEYTALIEEFGNQNPFASLLKAETNHASALTRLFEGFGLAVPEDKGAEFAVVPNSLQEAYELGIQAETDNMALYDEYLKLDLPDAVTQVLQNLRAASEHHKTTLEAYASGNITSSTNYGTNAMGGRWQNNR